MDFGQPVNSDLASSKGNKRNSTEIYNSHQQ